MSASAVTDKQLAAFTENEHRAWLASMQPDENLIVSFAPGNQLAIVLASYAKWVLETCPMDAEMRLAFLEWLDRLPGGYLSARAVAAVEPCCEAAAEMIDEALLADCAKPLSESFDILTRWQVFNSLVRLNPSLMTAIRLCGYGLAREAALR